ncbi:uncharacterized protein LOC106152620 [Lingula anatina]|uniref:Uncharacterized protein LOC106152620 n=1 Tax=Lingula anatina TaxID=7574 RepID=A0A1S3H9C3_LINAN|nr:uncharacterized protein LOC106152620 [Lingula anatina]|eukprot:XP_013381729.1 uncharacterized protein LOC106152620 [Lingula anatina]
MNRALVFIYIMVASPIVASWNPDAGYVPSLTAGGTPHTTSNPSRADKIMDGDDQTHWQSGSCFPRGFTSRPDLNALYNACALQKCSVTGDLSGTSMNSATDDSHYTGLQVKTNAIGVAGFTVRLCSTVRLRILTIKGIYGSGSTVTVNAITSTGRVAIATLTPEDNYKLIEVIPDPNILLSAIELVSNKTFTLTEIAAMSKSCYEMAWIDMGSLKEVSVINTKHWAGGNALATSLLVSQDGVEWTKVADLDPNALKPVYTRLSSPQNIRYIGVRHEVEEGDVKKVYVWEIKAYDYNGVFGSMPNATQQNNTLRNTFGVNGIWGWGTKSYSYLLPATKGPNLYAEVSSHARNYHNLNWDVTDPDHVPDYGKMANGKGTEAHWWLNWDKEYQAWVDAGLTVHGSVQFGSIPSSKWDDPYTAGYNFGYAYARHFGPTHGNGLIAAMEAGNEPWKYPADLYREILRGFSEGSKAADPQMTFLPAAFQADDPVSTSNYMGNHIPEISAPFIDVLNSHHYSFHHRNDGVRTAVHPEHPDSTFNGIRNVLRWRDANLPGKPVWVTEWGWDAPGLGEICATSECVSNEAQAIYGVRGLLILTRLGVERATWFFYANTEDCDTLFCRSGLTGSKAVDFEKKDVFRAFKSLFHHAGDKVFLQTIREDRTAYIYVFGTRSGTPTHLVAWRPDDVREAAFHTVLFSFTPDPSKAWLLTGDNETGRPAPIPTKTKSTWRMMVSVVPTIVKLN